MQRLARLRKTTKKRTGYVVCFFLLQVTINLCAKKGGGGGGGHSGEIDIVLDREQRLDIYLHYKYLRIQLGAEAIELKLL